MANRLQPAVQGYYRIRVFTESPTTEDIGSISILGSTASQRFDLLLGQASDGVTNITLSPYPTPACRNWGGIQVSGTTPRVHVQARIGGNLNNIVECRQVARLDIDGNVEGWINNKGVAGGTDNLEFLVVGGSVNNSVRADNGNIVRVSVSGNYRSTLNAQEANKDIGTVTISGDLAPAVPGGAVSVFARQGRLNSLVVGGSIAACSGCYIGGKNGVGLIDANSITGQLTAIGTDFDPVPGNGKIGRIVCRTGDFGGTLWSRGFEAYAGPGGSGIAVAGNLTGTLTFSNGTGTVTGTITEPVVVSGSVTSTGSIIAQKGVSGPRGEVVIGGSLAGTLDLQTLTTGLNGQVIINADHNDSTWSGQVKVGPTATQKVLSTASVQPNQAPNYEALPAQLTSASGGSGAVGLVPFNVHRKQSDAMNFAANGTSAKFPWSHFTNLYPCTQEDIVIEFYGPVARSASSPASAPLLSVEFIGEVTSTGGRTISDIDVSDFLDFTTGTTQATRRQVRLHAQASKMLPWGEYVVRPWADGRLRCFDPVSGDMGPVRGDFEYHFILGEDCEPECTMESMPCPVGTFFPSEMCDDVDFNNDGLFPDTQDVTDFLNVFAGAPCPTEYCNDIDVNNDSLFPDTLDINAFISIFSGGPCFL